MKWHDGGHLLGSERVRSGFLLLPRTIGGETRWLERASWVQRMCGSSMLGEPAHEPYRWRDVRWLDAKEAQ